MADKMNSEFNYKTQIVGETPWERIKTLKGFLNGRTKALAMEPISKLRIKAMEEKLKHLQEFGPKWEAMELECELMEVKVSSEDMEEAYDLTRKEIDFIKKYMAELYEMAEPTRIPGYTDDEMFEVNAENEFATWVIRQIQSELIANGRFSASKLRNAMSSKLAINGLKSLKLLPEEFQLITGHNDLQYLIDNKDKHVNFISYKEEESESI